MGGQPNSNGWPLSVPPLPGALERAASNVADSTALDPSGTDEGMRVSLQTMYLDERVYSSVVERPSPCALPALAVRAPARLPRPLRARLVALLGGSALPGRGRAILAPSLGATAGVPAPPARIGTGGVY